MTRPAERDRAAEARSSTRPTELDGRAAALLAAAAGTLGLAVARHYGHYDAFGLALVALATALALAALAAPGAPATLAAAPAAAPAPGLGRRGTEPLVAFVLAALLALQIADLLLARPVIGLARGTSLSPLRAGVAAAALVVAAAVAGRPLSRWHVPLLVVLHLAIGAWVLRHVEPSVDVFVFQHNAANALLRGQSPYGIDYPNIYPDPSFYGPGLVEHGRLKFGFPYPPLPLLLALPGKLLTGDLRFSHLAAFAGAGLLVGRLRPGRVATLAAALLLFSPRAFLIEHGGWIEPFVVLGLAATAFVALRAPRALPVALGLFLASKQYLVFAVPLAALLAPDGPRWGRRALALVGKALAVAALVTLPLALTNIGGFMHSVVLLQLAQPFRPDALGFPSLLPALAAGPLALLPFVLASGAVVLALARLPRTPAGFAAALAAAYLPFIAFSKQAFGNYYFLVIGAACVAVAASAPRSTGTPEGIAGG